MRASPAEPADIYGAPPTADDDPEPIPEIDPGPAVEPVPEKPPVVRIEEQPASIYGGPPSDAWDEDPTIAPTKDDKKKKE